MSTRIKAVLFDLDDTLFDHRYSSHSGLAVIQQSYQCFQQQELRELERAHLRLLNDLHLQVLKGDLSLEEARIERFRQLFSLCGQNVPTKIVEDAAARYREVHQTTRRPVPGVIPLLRNLRSRVKVAVVTNNLVAEQRDKLQYCGLDTLIDALVVSEEVGVAKPEPAIFEAALSRTGCRAGEAVMIGDSWSVDVLGALGVGMSAIWLNRYSLSCPDPLLAAEINAFEPLDTVLELLFDGTE